MRLSTLRHDDAQREGTNPEWQLATQGRAQGQHEFSTSLLMMRSMILYSVQTMFSYNVGSDCPAYEL